MQMIFKLFLSTSITLSLLISATLAMEVEKERSPSSLLTKHVHLRLPYGDFEGQASVLNPKDFRRLSPGYEMAVRSLRHAHASYKGQVYDAFFGLHNPGLYPTAREMEKFLLACPAHPFTQRLLQTLRSRMENEEVTPYFLYSLPFRHAASRTLIIGDAERGSNIRDDERDLFSHVPFSETFFAPLENAAWKTDHSTVLSLNHSDGLELSSILPGTASTQLFQRMRRLLPMKVYLPFMGEGHFGPSFLVKCYLHDMFPQAFPLRALTAHGIRVSPFGFGVHDALHGKVDPRHNSIMAHVARRGEGFNGCASDNDPLCRRR